MRELDGSPRDAAPGTIGPIAPSDASPPPDALARDAEVRIAAGVRVDGALVLPGRLRIDGRACGDLAIGTSLVVGVDGIVEARIECPVVEIHGRVTGDIVALDTLVLHATAELTGHVVTRKLVMKDGARLQGRVRTWPQGRPYLRVLHGGAAGD
jgi:cytoskeletal protein CcmA (bactofilin family)